MSISKSLWLTSKSQKHLKYCIVFAVFMWTQSLTPLSSCEPSDPRTGVHKGLICGICNEVYKHRGSLHHHMKRVHKSDKPHTTGSESILCKEAECSFHCRHLAQLRQHLSLQHGIEMMTEKKTFKSDEGMCQQWPMNTCQK